MSTQDGFAGTSYHPPEAPTDDHPLWLGLKVGLAMFLADLVASQIGFESPTWSIITAAYLAVSPPVSGAHSAVRKLGAMLIGIGLGIAGAYAHQFVPAQGVAITFAVIGLIAGALATRAQELIFCGVVATVITFVAQTGNETVIVEALQAAIMILIGCIVGVAVVWGVERLRARLHERRQGGAHAPAE